MNTIAIVDYGMGNFHSVARALRAAAPDADIRICRYPAEIESASRVVFPGQGAMPDCIRTLNESGLREAVLKAARSKPLLGVCVGEQMLFTHSEEGDTDCLNIFPGQVKRFAGPQYASSALPDAGCATRPSETGNLSESVGGDTADTTGADRATGRDDDATRISVRPELLKVPHMGWNRVRQVRAHPIWAGIPDDSHFYFVHSYYVQPDNPGLTVGETHYGIGFTCAIAADNIFAVQFHPEKSADTGLRLYRNFVDWKP